MNVEAAQKIGNAILALGFGGIACFCWTQGWESAGCWCMFLAVWAAFSV